MHKRLLTAATALCYLVLMCGGAACHNDNAHDEVAHHHHDHGHVHDHEHSEEEGHDHEHEGHDHEHESHEHGHEGHNHGNGQEITLEPEQAKLLGVETQTAHPGTFHTVVKCSGELLTDAQGQSTATAPVAGTVSYAAGITEGSAVRAGQTIATVNTRRVSGGDPNAAAKAAVSAAQREVDRLRPLHEKGIVTTAEMNAALAALDQARAMYSSAGSTAVTAPAAGTVTRLDVSQGGYVDAGGAVAQIVSGNRLTLRADVPQRDYPRLGSLTGATVKADYTAAPVELADLGAKRQGGAAVARGGYIPVYFSIANNGTLVAGSAVEVYLQGAPRQGVITVPLTALSEQQGNYYVYIKVDDEGYLKSPVTLGQSDGRRVEILNGVHDGDDVVVRGMTAVRLAESSGIVPEGHSHTH